MPKPHQCTRKEAQEIKRILWKYFDERIANDILIVTGKRKGTPKSRWYPWAISISDEQELVERRNNAKAEMDAYLIKRQIYGEEVFLTEEEKALFYDSSFFFSSY